jgi:hypothetical protein
MKVCLDIDGIGFDYSIMDKVEGRMIELPCMPVVGQFNAKRRLYYY